MLLAWILGLDEAKIDSKLDSCAFILGLPLIFGFIQLIILPFCYDSPSYLALTDSIDKADQAAKFYNVELETENSSQSKEVLPISSPLFYKPLLVACMMMLSQQLSGINAIFFYSTSLFANAGVQSAQLSTVYVGVVNVVFTFVSLLLIDRFGRKVLHIIGLSGMFGMAIALGTTLGFYLDQNDTVSRLSVIFVLLFVAFFQCGPGSIPWFISAELFDNNNRQ